MRANLGQVSAHPQPPGRGTEVWCAATGAAGGLEKRVENALKRLRDAKKRVRREDSSLPGLTLRAVEINYRCLARHVLARVQWAAISGLDTRLTWVTG